MRHELDGENVGPVAREQGGVESERGGRGIGLVGIQIDMLIIGP